MKKWLFIAAFLISQGVLFAQKTLPEFVGQNASAAVVLDIRAHRYAKDMLVLMNYKSKTPMSFRLYTWRSSRKWIEEEPVTLEYLGDKKMLGRFVMPFVGTLSVKGKPISAYRYIVIAPDDGKKINYTTTVINGDLYFNIMPDDTTYKTLGADAVELNLTSLRRLPKNNIVFISHSTQTLDTAFYVFGDAGSGFHLIGIASLPEYGARAYVERCTAEPLRTFYRYAIVSTDGNEYTYTPEVKSKNLTIYVND